MVLPHQLYEHPPDALRAWSGFVCLEAPSMFGDGKTLRVHKLRLAHMRASMRWYAGWLACQRPDAEVRYVDRARADARLRVLDGLLGGARAAAFDPTDHALEALLRARGVEVLEPPRGAAFLASREDLRAFHQRAGGGGGRRWVSHASFYAFAKGRFLPAGEPLAAAKSQDRANRRPLPPELHAQLAGDADRMPRLDRGDPRLRALYAEAAAYAERLFPGNPGSAARLPWLPVTHEQARARLHAFVKDRFARFGPYQDAVSSRAVRLYHADLSCVLNCGLLGPREVLHAALRAPPRTVPLQSREGFVRQLLGWREFVRYVYVHHGRALREQMGLGRALQPQQRQRLPAAWYDGATGLDPFDAEVRKLHAHAWAHHIVRLMVFLNAMRLHELPPAGVYLWFMEMVALDAYDWVMVGNLAAMGLYARPPLPRFARKPYVSGSRYVLRMSDYPRGAWCARWDAAFRAHVARHAAEPGYELLRALVVRRQVQ